MEKQTLKLFVVLIIVFLVGGFFLHSYYTKEVAEFPYNGFAVKKVENNYQIKLLLPNDPNPHFIYVRNNPKDIEEIPTPSRKDMLGALILNKSQVYFTTAPDASSKAVIAAVEISKFIANKYFFNIPSTGALTQVNDAEFPVITCENVTEDIAVVFLKTGKETKVYLEGDCMIVQGKNDDGIIAAADAVALRLIRIIE